MLVYYKKIVPYIKRGAIFLYLLNNINKIDNQILKVALDYFQGEIRQIH